METRANFAIITIFVLAVIGSAFLFVMWFTHTETGPKQRAVTVAFEDPVSGLVRGSDVAFNGIRVGDVRRVYMDPNVPSRAYAEISIDSDTPVRTDTRASLSTSTLSGTATLTLQGGATTAPELLAGPGGEMPVIVAQPSGLAALMEAAQNVGTKAETLRTQLGEVLAENRDSIGAIAKNVEPVIGLVNGDSPNARRASAAMSEAATRFAPVGTKLSETSDKLSALWQAVNPTRVAAIRDNASGLVDTIQANRPQIDAIVDNARGVSAKVGDISPKLDRTMDRGQAVMGAVDGSKLAHAMDTIDVVRGTLDASRSDLDATQQNLASIQDKMDRLSDRFARVRQQAADFIGSDGTTNAFSAVSRAAASIRRTSNNLSGYVQTIGTSITRFRGTSSREITTLGADAKRALDDAKRAGNHISNNPSSVIFGGSSQTLPTYNGR